MCLAESTSLKEITRTMVCDSFGVSLRCSLWIKVVLKYISISTLLKILLNISYSQGSIQFSTLLSFSKTIPNHSLLNLFFARMLLVSNLSVHNVGLASLSLKTLWKKKIVATFISNSKLCNRSASEVNLLMKGF